MAPYYPTYAEFQPLKPGKDYDARPMQLMEVDVNGISQIDPLNAKFDDDYLKDPQKPRWVAKPTVAYLWTRTVRCKNCRATVPLLKTRWLCKKDNKRVLLTMEPNTDRTSVVFDVQADVPWNGGNAAQRRENDKRLGAGTMSRKGAFCPCCNQATMTMEDIRLEGRAGRLGAVMTAVVVDGPNSKEYRLPTDHERTATEVTDEQLHALYSDIPFGFPEEPLPGKEALGFRVPLYGIDTWRKLYTNRQLLALGFLVQAVRRLSSRMEQNEYPEQWRTSVQAFLAIAIDRLASISTTLCRWENGGEFIVQTFARFALPILWDYAETCVLSETTGGFSGGVDWVSRYAEHAQKNFPDDVSSDCLQRSAIGISGTYDAIVTDPPYYDAIPYSDLMDFFYVWLRRSIYGISKEADAAFCSGLGPKWDHGSEDGELIDDASRFDGDKTKSTATYEDGMARAFVACANSLTPTGRMVVVFANKQPAAWETLVSALIRSGFVVDGSWPIQTERIARARAHGSAALSSSVWLVCRKRQAVARPGWDNNVLNDMRENITQKLRDFWDAGIRGPDFVWAATGPALEAFSKYPVVKKANDPNQLMTVSEFLREVRRMVVDFVVGRVLTHNGGEEVVTGLDDVTTYYLLHRRDFGMDEAPIGACILYALSCNLSDSALVNQFDVLGQTGKASVGTEDDEDNDAEDAGKDEGSGSGAKVKLRAWSQRSSRNLGLEAPGGRPVPLIDQVHKLMHLWRAGDQVKVDDYLDSRGLNRNALFNQILQALIKLAASGSDERSLLESLSNHVAARSGISAPRQGQLV